MEKIIIIINLFFSFVYCYGQTNLKEHILNLDKKIQVGMNLNEVKKIMGTPSFINAGYFEDRNNMLQFEPPLNFIGQLIYVTLSYNTIDKTFTTELFENGMYWINKKIVPDTVYQEYSKDNEINVFRGEIISKNMYKFLAGTRAKKNLELIKKDINTTGYIGKNIKKVKLNLYFQITFEKSTMLVSNKMIYIVPSNDYCGLKSYMR